MVKQNMPQALVALLELCRDQWLPRPDADDEATLSATALLQLLGVAWVQGAVAMQYEPAWAEQIVRALAAPIGPTDRELAASLTIAYPIATGQQ